MYVKQDALVAYHTKTDTTYVHGEIISIVGKEGEQIMNAFYNGKILSGNLSGKCDSIYFDQSSYVSFVFSIMHIISFRGIETIQPDIILTPIFW